MEQKWYAVLMNKKALDMGIFYFSPISLIEGNIEKDEAGVTFIDNFGKEYISINSSEMIFNYVENGVGYGITKDELLKKYNTTSIEEAKKQYYDEICSTSYFGFYMAQNDTIGILPIDLFKISKRLNNVDIDSDSQTLENLLDLEYLSNDPDGNQSENGITECIVLDVNLYKDLLEAKTYDEVMGKLRQIYQEIEWINKNDNTYFKNGEEILKVLDESYDSFTKIESVEEMKAIIKQLEDYYIELSVQIDESAVDEKKKAANEYLNQLVDAYDKLLKIEDIETIRQGILSIKEKSKKHLVEIAKTYDDTIEAKQRKTEELQEDTEENKKILDVREIKSYFDQVIIGQEEAKKDVISAIVMNKLADDPHAKNSCLLVGPTGSGKTLIAETVSKYFDMPMEIIDTTQLTIPGYKGADIEDFLIRLLDKAGGIVAKAEAGIIVFDEIDKKGSKENDDISGKGVLNTFLSFIQGTTYNLKYNGRVVPFNTSKLTFFATGAFTDVAEAKKEDKLSNSYSNSNIGFNARLEEKNTEEDIVYEKLETEDFVKFGNMPIELMGRFSTIAQLSGHTRESLKRVLTESLNSPLLAEQTTLAKANIFISWDESYIDALAEKALMAKEGARALKKIVEKTIKNARWEALSYLGEYSGIHLTAETVKDNSHCELIGNDGSVYQLKEILEESNVLKRERKR